MRELVWLASFDADVQSEYERQEDARPGQGDVFFTDLQAALHQLDHFPFSGAGIEGSSVRRLLVLRRRFGVIYVPAGSRVMLHLLIDQRAHPALNARRIRAVRHQSGKER